jgi:hypothetical protein
VCAWSALLLGCWDSSKLDDLLLIVSAEGW